MAKKRSGNGFARYIWVPFAVAALIIAFLYQYKWNTPNAVTAAESSEKTVSEIANRGAVRISEIMSSNKSALTDDKGAYSDWIELCNTSSSDVDITGWILTDSVDRSLPFTFPKTTLKSGEYILVYCSDTLENTPGYAYHAPFKLSASGDNVLLCNASGTVVESVIVPALGSNTSYAKMNDGNTFEITSEYTPGMKNTSENHKIITGKSDADSSSPIVISEMMAENVTYCPTEEGVYCDWIELHNTSDSEVSLSGYGLTDNDANLYKWRLPDVTISPNGYLLIYCDGQSQTEGELHASFKLSGESEKVILTDASGIVVDSTKYELLKSDVSWSRAEDGSWTKENAPTPGAANDASGVAQSEKAMKSNNTVQLYLNEAISSAHRQNSAASSMDWLELHNASNTRIELAGYGLSDDPSEPRKWQFPEGAYIEAGAYLAVALTGDDESNTAKQLYKTNFSLDFSGQETLTLSMPDGTIIDRMPMMGQRGGVSYGRVDGQDGFFYLAESTRGEANSSEYYEGLCPDVSFDTVGGLFDEGESLTVSITAPSGTIHYTTDCSEPSEESPVYTGPISISSTTILRAATFEEGKMQSLTGTQSYLFGLDHTLPILSVVSDEKYLYDEDIGIYVRGKGTTLKQYNYWKNWERAGNVEYFIDGETMFSQGVGIKIQGQMSRQYGQKGLKFYARDCYGKSTIEGKLFPNRDYTEFDSFLIRASGQDHDGLRFKDALLTTLAEPTSVLYQDAQPIIVYLNGEYFGHYNLREHANADFICRNHGWTDKDKVDIVKANGNVLQGSDDTYTELKNYVKKHGCTTEEGLAYVEERVDIDNYLDYIAIQMFIGNTDILNVKRYRSTEGDGKWRWILFDLDTAFNVDTDSYSRWLNPDGAGRDNTVDNTLFVALMKNNTIKEKFWRRLNELMANYWTTEIIIAKTDEWINILKPEMEMQFAKWKGSMSDWKSAYNNFVKYAKTRPKKLLGYINKKTGLGKEGMREYFGDIMDHIGM